ncbi:uncharacterized protein LOC121237527 isoform X1 [Juglans microcarpa x Juglans regia]|uniref:uncharacterized protein LOC121237527 isoform X1 n=1 Tax=Juglans microcarpa x Juglans regia TaxID=2249226 RepID=UPI001B7E02B1|nr:uncharacterized protein LOC121237527 isoform X1 [Juglans microcarpa x Juglans regia]
MVARNSPDWLPSGWTVQFKVQKTGRKIRIYTNLETGQKLFSKEDVIHRTKVNSSQGRKPLPKSRHIKMHSRNNPKPLAVETNENPEWLPKGWNMEVKARNNGMGAKYKCYIEPLTGCRFYSKPQVFQYLESVKRSSQTFRKRKIDILPPTAVKRQKLNHPETRRRLFADRGRFIRRGSELAEAKSSKRRQGNKASDEQRDVFAPTAEIVQKDAIKDSAETKKNCAPRRSALPKADSSKGKSQTKSLPPNNAPVSTPAVDILQENDDLETDVETLKENGSTRKNKITSSKSKKKKVFNLPCRSSKRLAGFEPEQVVNSVSSQQPFQVLIRRLSESGAGQDSGLASCGLSNGASQRLEHGQQMVNAQHGSTDPSHALHGEPSDESKKHLQNKAASEGPLEMLETDKMDDEVLEQEHCCPFGNSWSDPCLEFAIRTLTGALPLEDTTSYGAVLAPAANIQLKENLLEGGIKKSSPRKTQDSLKKSKNKTDLNLPRRSSKRLSGLEPEMVANSQFSERAIQNARSKSSESEATLPVVLADGASRQLEDGLDMELAHRVSNNINTPILIGESSNKSEKPLEVQVGPKEQLPLGVQSVHKEQPHFPETEIIMPEPQLAFPFGDSWPDPCLEFAFKTLTGLIPVEDNLAVQGSFQEELDISHTQRDSSLALPDFGLPSFFQNDISSHFDLPEKSMAGHQPSRSSSFLAPGNVSLPSCGGISSQQPCSEGDKDLHGKVNS